MSLWYLNADTLAGSRFVVSPLAETFASLKLLHAARPPTPAREPGWTPICPPTGGCWPTTRSRRCLSAAAWARSGSRTSSPPPRGSRRASRRASPGCARRPRRGPRPSHGLPARPAPRPPGPRRPAGTRRRTPDLCVDADRTPLLGPAAAHPGGRRGRPHRTVRPGRLGGRGGHPAAREDTLARRNRLQVNLHGTRRARSPAPRLFCPSPADRLGVLEETDRTPSSTRVGVLAQGPRTEVPESLGTLLGPARAGPRPARLADEHQPAGRRDRTGLGTVGRHLKVLLDARLVDRRRAGRSCSTPVRPRVRCSSQHSGTDGFVMMRS